MFAKIHHVAVICSDYEKSKVFYTRVLGLEIIRETYRESRDSFKLDLQLSNQVQLELFYFPDSPPRPSYPESCGLRHLSFAVDNIDESIAHLANYSVLCEAVRLDEHTGKKFTFFQDPDGLPLELYEN